MNNLENTGLDMEAVSNFKKLLYTNNSYIKDSKGIAEYILFKIPYNTLYDCIYISHNYNKHCYVTGIGTEFCFGCYYNHCENFISNVTYELERYLSDHTYDFYKEFKQDTGIAINNDGQSNLKKELIKYAEALLNKHVTDHVCSDLLLDKIDAERKDGYSRWAKNAYLKDTKVPATYLHERFYKCTIGDAMDYDEQGKKFVIQKVNAVYLANPMFENSLDYVEQSYLNKCIIDLKKKELDNIINNPEKYKDLYNLKRMRESIANQKTVKIHAKIIVNNISFDFINRVNAVRIKNFDTEGCFHCWELEPTTSRQVKEVAKCSYFCVSPEEISEIYYNGKTLYSKEEK